jgi:transposase-like protein
MPWRESGPMDERLQFVRDAQRDRFTMSELCARYGVSWRIGYKWLARYDTEGRSGLADRSHVPHHCPHKISDAVETLLVAERIAHPHQRDGRPTDRPGRNRRWDLGDLLQHHSARDLRRTGLHHSWLTKSVTYPPGHFCYPSSRLFNPSRRRPVCDICCRKLSFAVSQRSTL